jgi:hypothetical protein
MKQIFNIFRKDCRHFWPEILLTLAITAAVTSLIPYQWLTDYGRDHANPLGLDLSRLKDLAAVMMILMPVSWFILIARIVHDENLLGTKQFWVTRPYVWYKLGAEKLFFIVVFVLLPYLASQAFLLHRAGFPPTNYIQGLLFNLVLVAGTLVLPMLCLALVTSTLLRMIGTLLVVAVLIGVAAFFCPPDTFNFPSPAFIPWSYVQNLSMAIVFIFSMAIGCAQYASRKLWLSRALLALLPVVLVAVALGRLDQRLIIHFYPSLLNDQDSPIRLILDAQAVFSANSQSVFLSLPLRVSDITSGQAFHPDNIRLTIDTPEGDHWTSSWQAISMESFDDAKRNGQVAVQIDPDIVRRIQLKSVSLQFDLAFTEMEAGTPTRVSYELDHEANLPNLGRCMVPSDQFFSGFRCRLPMHEPSTTRISLSDDPEACPSGQSSLHGDTASVWEGINEPDPAELTFNPIKAYGAPFSFQGASPPTHCLRTTMIITPYRVIRRFRYSFTAQGISIPPPAKRTDYFFR